MIIIKLNPPIFCVNHAFVISVYITIILTNSFQVYPYSCQEFPFNVSMYCLLLFECGDGTPPHLKFLYIYRGSSPGYGGLVFLWSNFPSLMVDYCVQLGNLLLLITSPILIWYSYMILWLYRQWLNTIKFSRNMTVRIYEYLYWTRALAFGRLVRRSCSSSTQQWVGKPCLAWGIQ